MATPAHLVLMLVGPWGPRREMPMDGGRPWQAALIDTQARS